MPRRVRGRRWPGRTLAIYHRHDMRNLWHRRNLVNTMLPLPSRRVIDIGRRLRRGSRRLRRATWFGRRGRRRRQGCLLNDLCRHILWRGLISDCVRIRCSRGNILLYHRLFVSLRSSRRLWLLRRCVACLPHRDAPSPQTPRSWAALASNVAKIFIGQSTELAMRRITTEFLAQ